MNSLRNASIVVGGRLKKVTLAVALSAAAFAVIAPASVFAAVDAAVTTEVGVVKADISTVGGLIIGLAVTAMGIRWVKATFF